VELSFFCPVGNIIHTGYMVQRLFEEMFEFQVGVNSEKLTVVTRREHRGRNRFTEVGSRGLLHLRRSNNLQSVSLAMNVGNAQVGVEA
jgi:hypothetical protein